METLQKTQKERTLLEKNVLILFFICCAAILPAQTESYEFTREYVEAWKQGGGGVASAVTDVNLDGLEDVVRFNQAKELQIFLQLPDGSFQMHQSFDALNFTQWNILGFPMNDDRWLDWVSSGNRSGINYWTSDSTGGYEYLLDFRYRFLAQGASALDITGNDSLDLFFCSDYSENYTLSSSGQLPFDSLSIIPQSHPDPDFRAGNYASVWEDINGDGQADLYLSKCFSSAVHPSDPRRINQFYLSQSDGSYLESAHDWNVADSAQSWAASFADVDNDGLMDLLVINHDAPAALYMNRGDHFERSQAFEDLGLQFQSIQVIAQDFDCDGYVDFLVTGEKATVLMNQKGSGFVERPELLGRYTTSISSAQTGDFNQDGYLDIFATRHGLINNPRNQDDILLSNPFHSSGNHFIRFQIIDSTHYTMSGIQVKARLFSDLGMQSRTLRVGESYGLCGSNILHFGLGENSSIDSVVFDWPGGRSETYFPNEVNTTYLYTSGVGLSAEREVLFPHECFGPGDTTQILELDESSPDLNIYHNDMEISFLQSQNLHQTGRYFWVDRDESGAWMRAKATSLAPPSPANTTLSQSGNIALCKRQEIVIEPLNHENFLYWNTGDTSPTLTIDEAGIYEAVFRNCADTFVSDPLEVSILPEIDLSVENDTVNRGERAMLRARGENIRWYENEDSEVALQEGSTVFIISQLDRDTTLYAESREFFSSDEVAIGPVIEEDNLKMTDPWFSAEIEFVAHTNCELKQISVHTIDSGRREFQLLNPLGERIERKTFNLDSNQEYTIDLGWELEAGKLYSLTTNVGINLEEFGFQGPQLYSIELGDNAFPIGDGEHITITGTNRGIQEFFFFSEWVIQPPADTCTSERKPVRGVIDPTVSIARAFDSQLRVFPNPASDQITVERLHTARGILTVRDSYGKMIFESSWNGSRKVIPCHSWPSGMYILSLDQAGVQDREVFMITH